jgi:hypothetical protein
MATIRIAYFCVSFFCVFAELSSGCCCCCCCCCCWHLSQLHPQPAFPPELGDDLAQQLIEAWGFMVCLADLFGAPPFSMEALLSGLLQGSSSPLLGLVHVLLLRQAQADMEEAHATGVLQVGGAQTYLVAHKQASSQSQS